MIKTAHSLQTRSLTRRPTLEVRDCCDLKILSTIGTKWWLCRKTNSDHRITVETYDPTTGTYTVKDVYVDEETP